jgi:DNA-binding GntR family transcriptional regulator
MSKNQRSTLNQQAYKTLLNMLFTSEIPMGAQLDERDLSNKLGVSRTPLREAVTQLVREGLVDYAPYQGHFVKEWNAKQVEDLYIVRKSLEILAIQLVIPKLSNEDIDSIKNILEQARQALDQNDILAYGQFDSQFHEFIVNKTNNETLIQSLERLSLQIQMIRTIANRDPDVVQRTTYERPRILEALKNRDVESATHLMAEHIDGVSRAVVSQIRKVELKQAI